MARKLTFDQLLFAVVIGMTLFGVLMVYSASSIWALEHRGSSYHYLYRQASWAVLWLLGMTLAMVTCLIVAFSVPFQKIKQKYKSMALVASLGLLPGFIVAAIAFWLGWVAWHIQPQRVRMPALVLIVGRPDVARDVRREERRPLG